MANNSSRESDVALDDLFGCLASGYRRRLLAVLRDQGATSREALASALAARSDGKPLDRVTDEREHSQLALHHRHLPKLDAAGLLDYDPSEATVEPVPHTAFQDPGIQRILDDEEDLSDTRSLDQLFEALADDRRRTILDVLSHQYQPIRVETLAREVLAREQDVSERDPTEKQVEELLVSFHHRELPSLKESGLVDYDTDGGTVTYEGHPELRVPWMHSQLGQSFRASLTDSPADAEVGDIEGRENVVSFGQSLVDEADEELFMMFTTTGLLEAGCFTRIKQATERGVDIYLGTRDPTVREFVQENAPSVSLWEPETNWLNLPIEEDNVGRLVFADREAVLIGTLGEKTDDGVHEERAIVGEGATNTLVVLMRQMLRTHLEQIAETGEETEPEVEL